MNLTSYEQRLTNEKCKLFARMFQRAGQLGYSSSAFIRDLFLNEEFKDLIMIDERQEWCDECFLLACFDTKFSFSKVGEIYDDYELWFMGYLYKYWMRTRGASPKYVYRVLPPEKFINNFGFYHTEDWDYVIEHAIKHKDI